MKKESMPNNGVASGRFLAGGGIIAAFAGSLCCITPVVALIAGATGFAGTLSWIEPFRPYMIAMTVLSLGTAWYLKLKPRKADAIDCACDKKTKTSFIGSTGFLASATLFAILLIAFPTYAHIFYSTDSVQGSTVNAAETGRAVVFRIDGMTCSGCARHVEHSVRQVRGVSHVEASYEKGTARVEFDEELTSVTAITKAINATGYTVTDYSEK